MINLFRFIIRNSSTFLFITLELIALYLVVNFNQKQRAVFVNSSNKITATILEKNDVLRDYFNLSRINEKINQENTYLLNKIEQLNSSTTTRTEESGFCYLDAKIISNQIDSRYNRYLINKGRQQGVKKSMGVLSGQHPAGIVYQVTDGHASVISLLNINMHLSVQILDKGYFGLLSWQPPYITQCVLRHVPAHADVMKGDTVLTSGYSRVFPPNLPVGVVEEVRTPKGSNSHIIEVRIFADMGKLDYVQVLEYKYETEVDSLMENIAL